MQFKFARVSTGFQSSWRTPSLLITLRLDLPTLPTLLPSWCGKTAAATVSLSATGDGWLVGWSTSQHVGTVQQPASAVRVDAEQEHGRPAACCGNGDGDGGKSEPSLSFSLSFSFSRTAQARQTCKCACAGKGCGGR